MGRRHHEAVAVVIVLIMRCRVRIGHGIIGAVDHESNMVTTSRFEAVVRVISRVQPLELQRIGLSGMGYFEKELTRG